MWDLLFTDVWSEDLCLGLWSSPTVALLVWLAVYFWQVVSVIVLWLTNILLRCLWVLYFCCWDLPSSYRTSFLILHKGYRWYWFFLRISVSVLLLHWSFFHTFAWWIPWFDNLFYLLSFCFIVIRFVWAVLVRIDGRVCVRIRVWIGGRVFIFLARGCPFFEIHQLAGNRFLWGWCFRLVLWKLWSTSFGGGCRREALFGPRKASRWKSFLCLKCRWKDLYAIFVSLRSLNWSFEDLLCRVRIFLGFLMVICCCNLLPFRFKGHY